MRIFIMAMFLAMVSLQGETNYLKIHENTKLLINGDNSPLGEMYTLSLNADGQIQEDLVRVITLYMLNVRSAKFSDYLKTLQKGETTKGYTQFLEMPPLVDLCGTCKGHSKILVDCAKCTDGGCTNCKGEGVIVYGNGKSRVERECTMCKKSGNCSSCQGSGKIGAPCVNCRGKGMAYNVKAVQPELQKALKKLLNKSASLAGKEFDEKILKSEENTKEIFEKFLGEIKVKQSEWEELEKKRLTQVKPRKSGKSDKNGPHVVEEAVAETYEEGGSTKTLDRICQEISANLERQESKSGQSVLAKCYGQFLSDVPTVFVQVSDSFMKESYDYRQRAADGFYRFAILRANNNGYGNIDFKLLSPAGKQIGGVKNGAFWIDK